MILQTSAAVPGLPAEGPLTDSETQLAGHSLRAKHQPLETVPPESFLAADSSGDDEDGRRHRALLEQGLREAQVVGVTVVEGDRHAAMRDVALFGRPYQVAQRHGHEALSQ